MHSIKQSTGIHVDRIDRQPFVISHRSPRRIKAFHEGILQVAASTIALLHRNTHTGLHRGTRISKNSLGFERTA